MRNLIQSFVRLLVMTVVEGLSLLLMAWIIPGISIVTDGSSGVFTEAISIAIVLAILNGLVRPILVLLTLPISIVTLGLFTLVINALMLLLASAFLPFFQVDSFWSALGGAVILSAVNTLITGLITIDDDHSFYDGVVQWISRRKLEEKEVDPGRGIIMLEIDGLSYQRMQRALDEGIMPIAKRLVEKNSHALSHTDCGLPSQTSACQAGIMYGDNYNIPAFRWYDKEQGRLYVSNNFKDAAEINGRYSNGQGLLREGTSINNLMAGDANKAILTMSMLLDGPEEVDRRSPEDMYLVFVNPYFFTRALVLTIWDIFVEFFQILRQRIRNTRPRINRLEKAYPILRGVTNVFMRDVSTYTVILDIIRGSPAIYTTYVGYDEVAHHAGPDTKDAMDTLRGIDKQLGRILDVIERKAPRPYDVFVLSDHGQSYGATFLQRYGLTLSKYLESLLGGEAKVTEIDATENAQGHANVLLTEISNLQGAKKTGRVTDAALAQAARTLESQMGSEEAPPALMDVAVIACVSGNLANVYFDLHTGKVNQAELNAAHPGLVDTLVSHEGIGLVVAYDEGGAPWVLGKPGARNLQTAQVVEGDPLVQYGDPDFRAKQLLRLASFPHAGDLIVISTLYPDGQVAAFEELVGCHGGLGGQQTDSFLFHPGDMEVPPTSNSADVFYVLDARRGLPVVEEESPEDVEQVGAWSRENLLAGMRDISELLSRSLRALRLERGLFSEVADDPKATGQALLIFVLFGIASGIFDAFNESLPGAPILKFALDVLGTLLVWSVIIMLATVAGRVLKGRGTFSRSFRAVGFAHIPEVVTWLHIIPVAGPLFNIVGTVMLLVATWLALQESLRISKWRALLIPLVALVIVVLSIEVINLVASGTALTVETILDQLGLLAG
jgi:uncharacterized membrane protein YvlD (DUF360 family)